MYIYYVATANHACNCEDQGGKRWDSGSYKWSDVNHSYSTGRQDFDKFASLKAQQSIDYVATCMHARSNIAFEHVVTFIIC